MISAVHVDPTHAEMQAFVRRCCPDRLRTMREFAEQEFVIPDGLYAGRRFACHRQPYTGLLLDEIDSGRWSRMFFTGPTQSGKTLCAYLIPLLYHLFEIGETVICGVPDMDMASDKWREDLEPAISASRYKDLIPKTGGGSRGGKVETIQFRNGATLKFMSGGGGDKSRAGFTSRVLIVTETDGMDEAGEKSREADKITQLEARTRSFGDRKRIYMECTVSIVEGRTWSEYTSSTHSRLLSKCVGCHEWVAPEREHLTGWQDAENVVDAGENSAFFCPECGQLWSDAARLEMNQDLRLVHKGQTVENGVVVGEPPATDTLGFRWSAFQNMFLTPSDFGKDEWRASRERDEENAEKMLRQFVWAVPHEPTTYGMTSLDAHKVMQRQEQIPRGVLPGDTTHFTVGIDLGKFNGHYLALAFTSRGTGHIVDYGIFDVHADDMGVERAIIVALREFKSVCDSGWSQPGHDNRSPDQVWIDSGYMPNAAYAFCREAGEKYRPTKGYGAAQHRTGNYRNPKKLSSQIALIGEQYHISRQRALGIDLVEINADHWKTYAHERLSNPAGESGSVALYHAPAREHTKISKHFTAERKVEEYNIKQGRMLVKWERVSRQNHWLDAYYLACAAAHFAGFRLIPDTEDDSVVTDWFKKQRGRR